MQRLRPANPVGGLDGKETLSGISLSFNKSSQNAVSMQYRIQEKLHWNISRVPEIGNSVPSLKRI